MCSIKKFFAVVLSLVFAGTLSALCNELSTDFAGDE